MKKILYLFLSIFIFVGSISPVCLAQEQDEYKENTHNSVSARKFAEHNPIRLLDVIYYKANGYIGDEVQDTRYDAVTAKTPCPGGSNKFTISNTLCSLKWLSTGYLQYLMYIWLTAATILIIRNWFTLVTSPDREKQFAKFKKNITYIVVWVILLIGFYYIIDFFVSMVNLIAER